MSLFTTIATVCRANILTVDDFEPAKSKDGGDGPRIILTRKLTSSNASGTSMMKRQNSISSSVVSSESFMPYSPKKLKALTIYFEKAHKQGKCSCIHLTMAVLMHSYRARHLHGVSGAKNYTHLGKSLVRGCTSGAKSHSYLGKTPVMGCTSYDQISCQSS